MMVRAAHRARWTAVWVLLVAWFLALMLDIGGASNLLLLLAIAVLVYELLAVDRPA